MKYKAGEGYRLLKVKEIIPKGAQRLRVTDPEACWVPTAVAGRVVSEVPQDGYIYRVPKALTGSKAPEGKTLRAKVLEVLATGPKAFEEVHKALGEGRDVKATRTVLQDLQRAGKVEASRVLYSATGLKG